MYPPHCPPASIPCSAGRTVIVGSADCGIRVRGGVAVLHPILGAQAAPRPQEGAVLRDRSARRLGRVRPVTPVPERGLPPHTGSPLHRRTGPRGRLPSWAQIVDPAEDATLIGLISTATSV